MATTSNWMGLYSGVCEDGPESSAEPSTLGLLCQAGVHVLCSLGKPQRGISFWRGKRLYFIYLFFYFLTFHVEITSDFQKHCGNSTKDLLYTLHPFSPNANILYAQSQIPKKGNYNWLNKILRVLALAIF